MESTSAGPPAFLFFYLPPDQLERSKQGDDLVAPVGGVLTFYEDEEQVPRPEGADVGVIEAGRASRNEVELVRKDGVYELERIPMRFVLSARRSFTRQISAGGVMARGRGEEVEFALMRTLPRKEAVARQSARLAAQAAEEERPEAKEEALVTELTESEEVKLVEIEDPREAGDRRATDRRKSGDARPPERERRRGRSRRVRRRRRSARWGPNGRLELPKGKLEPGEPAPQAAVREVQEELGVSGELEVGHLLSKNHYTFRTPDGKAVFKTVYYYLLLCSEADPSFSPRAEEGVIGVEWWSAQRAIQQVAFPNLKPVLQKAWDLMKARPSSS